MIPYIYHPILFQIGPIKIFTWGFIAALAFLAAYILLIKTSKLNKKHLENIFFIILISSIIGSRILYLIEYPPKTFFDIIKIWEGGLSLYGGLILTVISSIIYTKINKLKFIKYANSFTLPIILGLIIGRIACLVGDGGHLGKTTTFFLGTLVNNQILHYTALYSIIALSVIFLILLKTKQKFSLFLVLYGLARFFIDFTRADPTYFSLTIAQYSSIVIFIIGLILYFKHDKSRQRKMHRMWSLYFCFNQF